MDKVNQFIGWAILTAGATHMFCCGLPIIVSMFSLLSGLGLIVSMPSPFEYIHEIIHGYELAIITFSAIVLISAWVLHFIDLQLDCRDTGGCAHEPCGSKKKKSDKILMMATVIFLLNVAIYIFYHH